MMGGGFGDKSQPCAGFDVINTQIKLKLNRTEASATKLNKLKFEKKDNLNESNKLRKHMKILNPIQNININYNSI